MIDAALYKQYPEVGRCIYCPSTEELAKEHVLAFAMGGNVELPKASCPQCAKATCAIEWTCARRMFAEARATLGIQTRNPGQRPKTMSVFHRIAKGTNSGSQLFTTLVNIEDIPPHIFLPFFFPPDMLFNITSTERDLLFAMFSYVRIEHEKFTSVIDKYGLQDMGFEGQIGPLPFARMIAKISHAFAVAECGLAGFRPLLLPLIKQKSPSCIAHLVGGFIPPPDPPSKNRHELSLHQDYAMDKRLLVCKVRLFADLGGPTYQAIVGEI